MHFRLVACLLYLRIELICIQIVGKLELRRTRAVPFLKGGHGDSKDVRERVAAASVEDQPTNMRAEVHRQGECGLIFMVTGLVLIEDG